MTWAGWLVLAWLRPRAPKLCVLFGALLMLDGLVRYGWLTAAVGILWEVGRYLWADARAFLADERRRRDEAEAEFAKGQWRVPTLRRHP